MFQESHVACQVSILVEHTGAVQFLQSQGCQAKFRDSLNRDPLLVHEWVLVNKNCYILAMVQHEFKVQIIIFG